MLINFFSWVWIAISSYLCGNTTVSFISHISGSGKQDFFRRMLFGMLTLTVYAEVYSLFGGVDFTANIILLVIVIVMFFCNIEQLQEDIHGLLRFFKEKIFLLVLVALCAAVVLLRSSMAITSEDTYLYHAQSIRWISEYGVVPGLGNLHTRYAFNSAFLCLQALFSLPFATGGVSLHSVNGFVVLIMLLYAICTLKSFSKCRFYISDFLRGAILVYCCRMANHFSSPETDIMALLFAMYIVCEWVSLSEEKTTDEKDFCPLCLLILMDISYKLSTAMLILLTIRPILALIRQKKVKLIFFYIMAGFIVIAPFLIRNIILSGWLVYPVALFDVFDVDWKIPVETLRAECSRTLLSARNVYGVFGADAFCVWFPQWLKRINGYIRSLLILDIFSAILLTTVGVCKIKKEKDYSLLHVTFTLIICLIYWWFSAPAVRFAFPFMFMLPMLLLGVILFNRKVKYISLLKKVSWGVLLICLFLMYQSDYPKREHLIFPADYVGWTGSPVEYNGISFYIPDRMNVISYYYFPSAVFESTLDLIEMRGQTLAEGFRPVEGVTNLF